MTGGNSGALHLSVEVEGTTAPAIAYPALSGPVGRGARVLLNTTAITEGLGSGGYHFVVSALEQQSLDPAPGGHIMKLRYTPMQAKVTSLEEQASPHRQAFEATTTLGGLPVVWLPLHSMLGAACAGARAAGAARVVHVMTDGAALPAWFSKQIADLRTAGLLDAVITCGQALGGDYEAVNLFSALLAGRGVAGADVVVVADGPGKVGTGTRWGASDVAAGMALNAIAILGGSPVAALRLNFADMSYRHHGVSPHSLTVLREVALVPVSVPVPVLEGERRAAVWAALQEAGLDLRHRLVEVSGEPALELLRERGLHPQTMGRTLAEEPDFFLAAGAAGVLAGQMAGEKAVATGGR